MATTCLGTKEKASSIVVSKASDAAAAAQKTRDMVRERLAPYTNPEPPVSPGSGKAENPVYVPPYFDEIGNYIRVVLVCMDEIQDVLARTEL